MTSIDPTNCTCTYWVQVKTCVHYAHNIVFLLCIINSALINCLVFTHLLLHFSSHFVLFCFILIFSSLNFDFLLSASDNIYQLDLNYVSFFFFSSSSSFLLLLLFFIFLLFFFFFFSSSSFLLLLLFFIFLLFFFFFSSSSFFFFLLLLLHISSLTSSALLLSHYSLLTLFFMFQLFILIFTKIQLSY